MAKVNCTNPNHDDQTASMEVYNDGGFCFACSYVDKSLADENLPQKTKENIKETIAYIQGLPRKEIRGLYLPYDSSGFYILWPDNSYYKKRMFQGETRYIGPRGHRAPLYLRPGSARGNLVLIEGELNAESVYEVFKDYYRPGIASPGSANEFMRHIEEYLYYNAIYAILDKDPAGVAAGVELKNTLSKRGIRVNLIAVTRDYNAILQEEGKEGLKEQIFKDLGMSTGV